MSNRKLALIVGAMFAALIVGGLAYDGLRHDLTRHCELRAVDTGEPMTDANFTNGRDFRRACRFGGEG